MDGAEVAAAAMCGTGTSDCPTSDCPKAELVNTATVPRLLLSG
jgi:hypothetical protein